MVERITSDETKEELYAISTINAAPTAIMSLAGDQLF